MKSAISSLFVAAIDWRLARFPDANPVPDALILVTMFVGSNLVSVLLAIDSIFQWRAYLPSGAFGETIWVAAVVLFVSGANYVLLVKGGKEAAAIAAARERRPLRNPRARRLLLVYVALSILAAPALGYVTYWLRQ